VAVQIDRPHPYAGLDALDNVVPFPAIFHDRTYRTKRPFPVSNSSSARRWSRA
jgi:hypothetical protein